MFSGRTNTPGPDPGSPQKELLPGCYTPSGTVDPATWHYYTGYVGVLTGTGNYDGSVVDIFSFMHFFQVGVGASGKNQQQGASGWFVWSVLQQPTNTAFHLNDSCSSCTHGDFNFNFSCTP